jgi:hypothetical protein
MDLVANKWVILTGLKSLQVKCVGSGRKNVPEDYKESVERCEHVLSNFI